jgi:glycosyltransferase involved in cell wall biosynthesis
MQLFPLEYLSGASMTTKLFFRLKNAITRYQIKHAPRFIKALAKADTVICSTNVESRSIEWFGHPRVVVIPETSCMILPGTDAINTNRHRQKSFKILWVGKFDYRKQLHLALQVVARSRDLDGISLHVLGTGNQQQQDDYKQMATELRIDHLVTWHGSVPYATVLDMMKEAQLLLFTSVSEATSTVVMDALSCLLPVLCFNTSGMGTVITPSVGVKVELSTPGQSVGDFASHIGRLHANRELLDTMSANCRTRRQELSWDEKAQTLKTLYNQVLSRNQQPGHHDAR